MAVCLLPVGISPRHFPPPVRKHFHHMKENALTQSPIFSRIAASRFFTVSLLFHVIIVVMLGGAVLFNAQQDLPDFAADAGGFLSEDEGGAQEPPPATQQMQPEAFTPTVPSITAPSVSAITTTSTEGPSFSMTPTLASVPVSGMQASMDKAMSSMTDGAALTKSLNQGMGGLRTGKIYGTEVKAKQLGVIIDVSYSAHKFLAGAIKEIQKSFPDAIIVLYPGCGIQDIREGDDHKVRQLSEIDKKEIDDKNVPKFSSAGMIKAALNIKDFEKVVDRPANRKRIFLSWSVPKGKGGKASPLINHTEVAFEYLLDQKVDSIFWFADFQDPVKGTTADKLRKTLKRKKVPVHISNFSGKETAASVKEYAEDTGGSVTSQIPGK